MWYNEDNFTVKLGGNFFTNTPNLIDYKGTPLFEISRSENSEDLGIDFKIFDKNGKKIASVKRGRIYEGNKEDYEVIIEANRYILIEKATDKILCEIKKRGAADKSELEVNVHLYTPDGFLINATPDSCNIGTNIFKNIRFNNCAVGIGIG